MASGVNWMLLFKLAERGTGIVSTIVLARLLLPTDFGVVAMAMSVVAILQILGEFGFDSAIIQNHEAKREHYDTAWTMQICWGAISAIALISLAKPVAQFYGVMDLETIIYWFSFAWFIKGFENIGVLDFRKNMMFQQDFWFRFIAKICGFVVTIFLAYYLRNFWALVFGTLTIFTTSVLLSYVMVPFRPRFSVAAWRDLFTYSKWIMATNILGFVQKRSADFTIGKLSGAELLGTFTIAQQIALMPTVELTSAVNRAIFPGLSKIAKEEESLQEQFLNLFAITAIIILPVCFGIMIAADLLVSILLGPNWTEVTPLLQILVMVGGIGAITSNFGSVWMAVGKPRIITVLSLFQVVIGLPLVIWLTYLSGPIGAAIAYLLVQMFMLPIKFILVFRTLRLPIRELVTHTWRPVLGIGMMLTTISILAYFTESPSSTLEEGLQLLAVIVMGAVSYIASVLFFWRLVSSPEGAERLLLRFVKLGA